MQIFDKRLFLFTENKKIKISEDDLLKNYIQFLFLTTADNLHLI